MAVLFNLTKSMKLTASFHIAAATMAFLGFVITALVKQHMSKNLVK